jgi:hypothetical protein
MFTELIFLTLNDQYSPVEFRKRLVHYVYGFWGIKWTSYKWKTMKMICVNQVLVISFWKCMNIVKNVNLLSTISFTGYLDCM